MDRPGVKQRFQMTEVAAIVGCTSRTLRKPAMRDRLGVEFNPTTGQRFLSRDRLLRYLVETGHPAESYLHILQPAGGRVFCLWVPPDVRQQLTGTRPIPVKTALRLGMALAERPARGVVIGVDWMDPDQAVAIARDITEDVDHPFVVGLFADAVPRGPAPFDGVLSVKSGRRVDALLAAHPITLRRVRR